MLMQDVMKRIRVLLIMAVLLVPTCSAIGQIANVTGNVNDYMLIMMGQASTTDVDEPVSADLNRSGAWGIYTQKGDPETADDDNRPIINTALDVGPAYHFGYTTIRIDGANSIFGDPDDGGWVDVPYSSATEIGNYVGLTGCYINSRWRASNGNIFAQFRMAIIRDQVRLEVFLRNDDTEAHNVGLRHCADSTTGGVSFTGGDTISYPYIPGRGKVMFENDMYGTDIPDYFELYDDFDNPKIALRNTLRLEDATPPDRVAIGWWLNLQADDWDYFPVTDRNVPDYGWNIWWDPVLLNPGESRTIVTYFGMAAASSSWTSGTSGSIIRQDPFCVAVQAPRALQINYDADLVADRMLLSNPFRIKAYVYNLYRDTTLTNVSVNLFLPPGLELLDSQAKQDIISIAPETEAPAIVWTVKATGTVTGELNYSVSVSGTPQLQKTVERSIMIPATGTTQFKLGWQMVAVPFKFSDSRIEEALNLDADTYSAYYWDPQQLDYRPVTTISPGMAFWLKSTIDRSASTVSKDALPLSGTESRRIILYTGWNQFGNPYLYGIPWGRVKVLGAAQDGPLTIEEASARNLIRRTIYWWDFGAGEYVYSSDPLTYLAPWQGYWIKALQPCQLIIPPVEQVGGAIAGQTTRAAVTTSASPTKSKDGWRLRLVAKAGDIADTASLLGIDSRAADAYDTTDIERPPSHEGYVAISFLHKDWGANSGSYLADIRRSTSGIQEWQFDVSTDQKNTDVVLAWPTIMEVPKDYTLKLVDIDGGVTKYLRTTSSYRYTSGDGGVRRFKLIAEPRGNGNRLLVTGLAVNTTKALGGATISYNLSADASTDIRIKNLSGQVVRSLATAKGVTRGINTLTWDYKSESGDSMPAGSYLLEVVATTPEGEVAKSVRPFLVAR